MKSIIVNGVSRAVVVVDGDIESEEVIDCAGKEKTVIFDEISLVWRVIVFFLISKGGGDCDVAANVAGFI